MLSKIENGNTSPSLKTLQTLATALSLPITTFFRRFEARRAPSTQKAVKGSRPRRLAARRAIKHVFWDISAPHPAGSSQNHIWSRCAQRRIFSTFQHGGTETIYMLEGEMDYRHGDTLFRLTAGDSLQFDADRPHGPDGAGGSYRPVSVHHQRTAAHLNAVSNAADQARPCDACTTPNQPPRPKTWRLK